MISVVIPAYNRRDSLLLLLEDLFKQTDAEFEVIVVDDKSPDDTADAVALRFPSVRLLRNEKNGGPAVSRNRGIRAATGEYIVGFDSDVRVPDRTLLKRVTEIFETEPGATGLAFRLLNPDGCTDDVRRWWHPVPISDFAIRQFATDYFSGTGYAFQRGAVIEAGLYPEILYMHYEEVELAYRILDAGGSIYYRPDIAVEHHEHKVSRRSEVSVFYKPRNQILLALACYPFLRAMVYLVPRVAYELVRAVMGGHVSDFIRAIRSACKLAPARLVERRPLQKETWKRMAAFRQGVLLGDQATAEAAR